MTVSRLIPLEYPTFNWNFEDSKKQNFASIIATAFKSSSELGDAKFVPNKKLMSSNNYSCAGGLTKAIHWLAKDSAFELRYLEANGIRNGNASTQLAVQYD